MEQASKTQCAGCGTDVPPDAPLGLCPACLLKRAMGATTAGGAGRPSGGGWNGGFDPPPVERLVPLFPQLEILEFIGRGGMGAVYKARQVHLDRFVAVKILPTVAADDPAFAERFAREARSLARLNHANVVTIHDFGRAGEFFYFVMEYVDGANLRQALLAKTLEPKQALAIVPQICDALQYAHDEGIVHRDIKPENVLLDKRGRVKIADFGLAKLLQKTPQNYTLTQTQATMGTLHYMAPEQTERPLEVDHRADIYSLGVVFYEMLTGELPLGRFAAPSEKASIDARLDEVVFKTLEKEPSRRYQQASEVKTSVQGLSTPPPPPRRDAAVEPEPVLPYAQHHPTPPYPQYSRLAWAGVIWGALGFASLLIPIALGVFIGGKIAIVLMLPLLLVTLSALVGMPVCGLLAISHVHRSNGEITGLRMAAFDALAFPLLIGNAALILLVAAIPARALMLSFAESLAIVTAIGLPLCVVLDFFIVRYAWRRISAALPEGAPAVASSRTSGAWRASRAKPPAVPVLAYGEGARYSRTALAGAAWAAVGLVGSLLIAAGLLLLRQSTTTTVVTTQGTAVARAPVAIGGSTARPGSTGSPVPASGGGGGGGLVPGQAEPFPSADIERTNEQRTSPAVEAGPIASAPTAAPARLPGSASVVSSYSVAASVGGMGVGSSQRTYRSTTVVPATPAPPTPTWGTMISPVTALALFPLLAVAFTAPFGATILGLVAISQIRQSNGRLCGMPLALFDTLAFPLLLLDVLIVGGLTMVVYATLPVSGREPALAAVVFSSIIAAAAVDVWLVRRIRDAVGPAPNSA